MSVPESGQPGEFAPPPPPAPPAPQASAPAPQDETHGHVAPPAYPVAPPAPPVAPLVRPVAAPAAPVTAPAPPIAAPAPPIAAPAPQQGYPAPAQPPGHGAQPYPGQGYPTQAYAPAAPARGLLPWVLGFLVLVPFPFVGGLASGVAMAASGGSARRAGGPAAENARSALNWGLTYLMVSTLLLILHFVLLFALTSQTPATGFFPIGIPITLYFAVSLLHLVLVIVGTVRVASGAVMRVPFAIPFVRA